MLTAKTGKPVRMFHVEQVETNENVPRGTNSGKQGCVPW